MEKGLLLQNLRAMNRNNNLSPIPFYETLTEQDFRRWYTYGNMFKNPVSNNRLAPFSFRYPYSTSFSVTDVSFFKCCGEQTYGNGAYDMSFDNSFEVLGDGSYGATLIAHIATDLANGVATVYYTSPNIVLGLPRGYYYIRIQATVDGVTKFFYSDLFYATSVLSTYTYVKWYDGSNLELSEGGIIPYGKTEGNRYYCNELYLDTEVGMPEYTMTEDGEERDGRFFPIKQISEKKYHCKAVLSEAVCDCLRTAGMADVVTIVDTFGRNYNVEHFEMEVNWLDGGSLAEVDITFETDTIVKKIAKSYGNITSR